ncbi:MAG: HAMP domain-containing protein, partial [ANME-2 cluster archaeon]
MNILKYIRSHLNVKLFLSFVIIIIVLTIVLIASVEFIMPNAFASHLQFMRTMVEGEGGTLKDLDLNLYKSFRSALYASLQFALPISLIAAIIISLFFSREFVKPIIELSVISHKISEGKYDQRVILPKEMPKAEMDELKQLAISFNQMASKLEQTENLRKQLIGDVSHELRTPISFIKGSMEGLIDGIVPKTEKTFYQVQVEAERLTKLVNDLQELSIIESKAYKLQKENFDINALISSAIENISPQFAQKNIRIIMNSQNTKITAFFDIDRIKQVLTNILANAYQYSEKGGTVNISTIVNNNQVLVLISDTGKGISNGDLPHIFTRFYRADKSRSRNSGGAGIGLTIAKQLIEAHGG